MGSRGPLQNPHSTRGQKAGSGRRSLADVPADELGKAKMPAWLTKGGRAFWRQYAPDLERRGLLTALDQSAFAMLCEAWAQLREIDEQIDRDGQVIAGPRGGKRLHPLSGVRNRTYRMVVEGMQSFGMTPSSRARIHVTPPRPVRIVDPMESLLTGRRDAADRIEDPRDILTARDSAS